ncbi:antirestriction Ral family protein, partial [Salmonella sp. AM027]
WRYKWITFHPSLTIVDKWAIRTTEMIARELEKLKAI